MLCCYQCGSLCVILLEYAVFICYTYMYVCVYVCMHVCMYACMYASRHTHVVINLRFKLRISVTLTEQRHIISDQSGALL